MKDETEKDPEDPNWWRKKPEYKFPKVQTSGRRYTEKEIIEGYAEELRTNTAWMPRKIVEHYMGIRHAPDKLQKFLLLMLDMHFDESFYEHLPKESDESNVPPQAELSQKLYNGSNEYIVGFFR